MVGCVCYSNPSVLCYMVDSATVAALKQQCHSMLDVLNSISVTAAPQQQPQQLQQQLSNMHIELEHVVSWSTWRVGARGELEHVVSWSTWEFDPLSSGSSPNSPSHPVVTRTESPLPGANSGPFVGSQAPPPSSSAPSVSSPSFNPASLVSSSSSNPAPSVAGPTPSVGGPAPSVGGPAPPVGCPTSLAGGSAAPVGGPTSLAGGSAPPVGGPTPPMPYVGYYQHPHMGVASSTGPTTSVSATPTNHVGPRPAGPYPPYAPGYPYGNSSGKL
ncbi:hypothetical protein FHG87_023612 [Trinorchestia longiramus]|nr:hypothetical protein FHG87_023612 [Trinorchestia longiramus]